MQDWSRPDPLTRDLIHLINARRHDHWDVDVALDTLTELIEQGREEEILTVLAALDEDMAEWLFDLVAEAASPMVGADGAAGARAGGAGRAAARLAGSVWRFGAGAASARSAGVCGLRAVRREEFRWPAAAGGRDDRGVAGTDSRRARAGDGPLAHPVRQRRLHAGLDGSARSGGRGRRRAAVDVSGRVGVHRRSADRVAGRGPDEPLARRRVHALREPYRRGR